MPIGPRSSRSWWSPVGYPATAALTALVAAAGLYTHGLTTAEHTALLERIGADVDGLNLERVLAMPIATFVQSSPGVRWDMLLMVALPLLALERAVGSVRAAATFLLSDWLTAPMTLAVLWGLARLGSGEATRLLDVADAGSSAAAHGAAAAAVVLLPRRWAIPAIVVLFGVVIVALGFQRLDAAIAHVLATAVGTGFGMRWRHAHGQRWDARPSASETARIGTGVPNIDVMDPPQT